MYYINYFFIFAIIGHFIETVFIPNFNSGILYGWWTPVYGFGAVLILITGKVINKINWNKKIILKVIATYFCSMILLSLIELFGGYLIKIVFNKELWNYEHHRFNIGHYISLEIANIWGISSILVLYVLKPIFDKFVNKIPNIVTYILIFLFITDNILTLILK